MVENFEILDRQPKLAIEVSKVLWNFHPNPSNNIETITILVGAIETILGGDPVSGGGIYGHTVENFEILDRQPKLGTEERKMVWNFHTNLSSNNKTMAIWVGAIDYFG